MDDMMGSAPLLNPQADATGGTMGSAPPRIPQADAIDGGGETNDGKQSQVTTGCSPHPNCSNHRK